MVSILEYVGKNDKQLEFEESYNTITAYLMENGEREYVGEISFAVQIIGDERTEEKRIACPKIANVLERYQKCGIATQIIKFAKKYMTMYILRQIQEVLEIQMIFIIQMKV